MALEAFLHGPLGAGTDKAGHKRSDGPAGKSTAGAGWGGCAEGLSALVERMGAGVEARGGIIQKEVSVREVQPLDNGKGMRVLLEKNGKRYHVDAKKVVLALDAGSMRKVKGVSHLPVLKQLKSEPLLRTYAVFPTKDRKSWFSGMAKEVVPGPIRFFIPMSAEKGLAMISYTEGRDARHWMNIHPVKKREHAVMKALRELYKDKEIPDPLFIKFHGWESGCTYWVPARGAAGYYDAEEESEKSLQPLSGLPLYVCSESFAVQQSVHHEMPSAGPCAERVGQSWMESGLEQADRVLTKLL